MNQLATSSGRVLSSHSSSRTAPIWLHPTSGIASGGSLRCALSNPSTPSVTPPTTQRGCWLHARSLPDPSRPGPTSGGGPSGNNGEPSTQQRPRPTDSTQEAVDPELETMWQSLKQQVKGNLTEEEQKLLDELSVNDVMGTGALAKLANDALGPLLKSAGVEADPLQFFFELVSLATFLQFITCGFLFYGTELYGHFDTGEAFRASGGLALGYLTRPFFKLEAIFAPVYNAFLNTFVPGTTYDVPEANAPGALAATLNSLGLTLAVAFLVPRFLWSWQADDCLQLVVPMLAGWFFFDFVYMFTLLYKLRR